MTQDIILDDENTQYHGLSPVCAMCEHFTDLSLAERYRRCKAFARIPLEIWQGRNNHTQAYPGDHGYRFLEAQDDAPFASKEHYPKRAYPRSNGERYSQRMRIVIGVPPAVEKGGEGSGNFNHLGRPGEVGGSQPQNGGSAGSETSAQEKPAKGGASATARRRRKEKFQPTTRFGKAVAWMAAHPLATRVAFTAGWVAAGSIPSAYVLVSSLKDRTPENVALNNLIVGDAKRSDAWSFDQDSQVKAKQESIRLLGSVADNKTAGAYVKAWIGTIKRPACADLHELACEVLGAHLTERQKAIIGQIAPEVRSVSSVQGEEREAWKRIMQKEYDETQALLKKAGLDPNGTVRVYRGVRVEAPQKLGSEPQLEPSAIESWTTNRDIARAFAGGITAKAKYGYVIAVDLPVKNICSTPRTGRGCLSEFEITAVNRDNAYLTGVVIDAYTPNFVNQALGGFHLHAHTHTKKKERGDGVLELPVGENWIQQTPTAVQEITRLIEAGVLPPLDEEQAPASPNLLASRLARPPAVEKGGEGSGNFGHLGRPGEVGGSQPGGGRAGGGARANDTEDTGEHLRPTLPRPPHEERDLVLRVENFHLTVGDKKEQCYTEIHKMLNKVKPEDWREIASWHPGGSEARKQIFATTRGDTYAVLMRDGTHIKGVGVLCKSPSGSQAAYLSIDQWFTIPTGSAPIVPILKMFIDPAVHVKGDITVIAPKQAERVYQALGWRRSARNPARFIMPRARAKEEAQKGDILARLQTGETDLASLTDAEWNELENALQPLKPDDGVFAVPPTDRAAIPGEIADAPAAEKGAGHMTEGAKAKRGGLVFERLTLKLVKGKGGLPVKVVKVARKERADVTRGFNGVAVVMKEGCPLRWFSISSGGFEDRDGEIVSTATLERMVARADQTGERGPLYLWHVPGTQVGTCDFQAIVCKEAGRPGFLLESGTFDDSPRGRRAAAYVAAKAKRGEPLGTSIKFNYTDRSPDGVYEGPARQVERSFMPSRAASFPWSQFVLPGARV